MEKMIRKNPLSIIIFTIFIDLLGYGILIPIIPLVLADPKSPDFILPQGMTIGQGYILLGLLLGIYPLMQFIATPILGQLSDKFGRKNLLILSIFGTCLSYIVFAMAILAKNIPLLFISRAVDGITGGNIAIAQAAIADVTAPKDRVKNFGLIGAVFGLGFIIGPYIGGKFSDARVISWFTAATPFWFAAILSFINVLSILKFFPETHKHRNFNLKINWGKSIHNIIKAYNMKNLRIIFLTVFLYAGGFTFFTTFFSIYLINKFNFTQSNIGDFFAYLGIWIAVGQAIITRLFSKLFKEQQILKVTIFGTAIFVLLYFLPQKSWQLLLVAPFFAICNGLSFANLVSLVSRNADKTIQGEVLGINASVQALSQAIPALVSGFIAARISANTPIIISFVVMFMGGIVFLTLHKST